MIANKIVRKIYQSLTLSLSQFIKEVFVTFFAIVFAIFVVTIFVVTLKYQRHLLNTCYSQKYMC